MPKSEKKKNYIFGVLFLGSFGFRVYSNISLLHAVGTLNSDQGERWLQQSNRVLLGSKPPSCVNKCLSCGPCMATLVIPSHSHQGKKISRSTASYHGDEDDSYYLLSWKCKCGDKLFQP